MPLPLLPDPDVLEPPVPDPDAYRPLRLMLVLRMAVAAATPPGTDAKEEYGVPEAEAVAVVLKPVASVVTAVPGATATGPWAAPFAA